MKYLKQFSIIIAVSFAGEVFNRILPLPVPSSIYGLLLMFILLEAKIVKVNQIRETATFILGIMPLFFVPSSVGFINAFPVMKKFGIQFVVLALVTTLLVMVSTGRVAQAIIRLQKKSDKSGGEK